VKFGEGLAGQANATVAAVAISAGKGVLKNTMTETKIAKPRDMGSFPFDMIASALVLTVIRSYRRRPQRTRKLVVR
jgi:hypothetical protein